MSTSHGADQESFVVPPSGGTTAHEALDFCKYVSA